MFIRLVSTHKLKIIFMIFLYKFFSFHTGHRIDTLKVTQLSDCGRQLLRQNATPSLRSFSLCEDFPVCELPAKRGAQYADRSP